MLRPNEKNIELAKRILIFVHHNLPDWYRALYFAFLDIEGQRKLRDYELNPSRAYARGRY